MRLLLMLALPVLGLAMVDPGRMEPMRPDMERRPDRAAIFELVATNTTLSIEGDIDFIRVTHLSGAEPIIIKPGVGHDPFATAADPFIPLQGPDGLRLGNNWGAASNGNGPAFFWLNGDAVSLQVSQALAGSVRGSIEIWLQR